MSRDESRRPRLPRHQSRARHGAHAEARSPVMNRRWSGTPRRELPAGTDLVVIPGGFSYGDYLRCGAIAARAPIMDAVRAFAGKGGLVLGVCNGFQILCEAGLLPGVLMRNAQLQFICRDVYLQGRALRHAVHPRLQCRPGDPRAGRARRGQLHRRRRDHRAAGRRGAGAVPLLRRPTA